MKASQIILFLTIISYCYTEITVDNCVSQFDAILKNKCTSINTGCSYNYRDRQCIQTNSCAEGDGNEEKCKTLIPPDFHMKKCKYNVGRNKCEEVPKECKDFGKARPENSDYIPISGDTCEILSPDGEGQKCALTSSTTCQSYYIACIDFHDSNSCNGKILADGINICEWSRVTELSREETCHPVKKNCKDEHIWNLSKDACLQLKTTESEKSCIYDEERNRCFEEYIYCGNDEYKSGENNCIGKRPLTLNLKEYDYLKKCIWNSILETNNCIVQDITCEEYEGKQASVDKCKSLSVKDSINKYCAYDSVSGNCYEEYKSCQAYTEKEIGKTKKSCESIKLEDVNKKCIYIREEERCMEKGVYENCEDYTGRNKYICESIISPTTNKNCILDKDFKCQEKTLYCSDVENEHDCLTYANTTDENKICFFDGIRLSGKCYEEYKRCEDYTKNDNSSECSSINLYSQIKCIYESNKCQALNKTCSDAKTKEECKLIEKTGVSNPEKKICDFDYLWSDTLKCFENYKYCSDYRENDPITCSQIKPYDVERNAINITSKCEYDSNIGCHRVQKECPDADGNPILCAKISSFIKDHDEKYCAYIDDKCVEHFKTCESYDKGLAIECEAIIPENSFHKTCKYELDSSEGKYKCITKNQCSLFQDLDYKIICEKINPNCTYSENTCISKEKNYDELKFYDESEKNEALCRAFETPYSNYNITLKEDKTGCEKTYKMILYSYDSSYDPKPISSQLMIKGIYLAIILFCLLI